MWRGKLEKLEKYETKNEKDEGGLGIICVLSKAEALFVRQTCRLLQNKEHNSRKPVPSDFELLCLCFKSPHEREIVWLIGNYVHYAWTIFQRSPGHHIDVDQLKTNLQHLYKLNQNGQNKLGIITW